MKIRSLVRQLLIMGCLTTFTGCVEYRHKYADGRDQYFGWPVTRSKLDPQLGSRGKAYLTNNDDINLHVGGKGSRRRLTISLGVIQYMSDTSSIEFGYRFEVYDKNDFSRGILRDWHDSDVSDLFYFGGRINF
jgi:hypothetical protein